MKTITYSDAGVNIGAADQTTTGFKEDVEATYTKNVIQGIGAFGGMFRLPKGYKDPILVSSMDGVGTKLKVALMAGAHRTVGLDLVHHCINDIAVQGAKPLYLFDYYGTGKLDPSVATEVIKGIARACKYNGLALLGGETAEMPGFYTGNTYDLVAHITGIVEHSKIPNPNGSSPAMYSLACLPAGFTPTDTRWPANSFLKWQGTKLTVMLKSLVAP